MRSNGSWFVWNAVWLFGLVLGIAACGDPKPDPKAPKNGQGAEMHGTDGQGGGASLPPLEEVEPADEDIEVPPAP